MNEYVSYEDLKLYLRITENDADDLLKGFTLQASRIFDAATRRRFYPRLETRYYDHPYDASVLVLDDDLLEVDTFTTLNGYIALLPGDYYLTCGGQHNLTPYDRIEMRVPALQYQSTPQRANAIAGIWGYHEDWGAAWDAVDALAAGVTASATSITVTDVDGADLSGMTPRFKVQQTIRINAEYMYVTGKDTSTNTLTVRRGVNGTTAVAHDKDVAVSVYRPMQDVWHAVRRLAAWLYGQKDQPYAERIQAAQQGIISIPEGLPADVKLTIRRYSR